MSCLKNELISIIVPCYNSQAYIIDTLNSISNQSYDKIEIVIVDDGSTDDTKSLITNYIKENNINNILYFYKENGGVSSARNYGIEHCNGKYIIFVDSDDLVDCDMVKELYENMCFNDSDFVISNGIVVKNGKRIIFPFNINSDTVNKKHLITSIFSSKLAKKKFNFDYNFCRSACCKLFKKSIIDKNEIRFDNNVYLFEDGYFNLNYLKFVKSISYTDKPLYIYNIEQGGSSKFRPNIIEENEYKIKLLIDYISLYEDKFINMAFDIYNIDLFFAFVKKYLNDKNINIIKKEKLNILKRELMSKYINSFNLNVFSSLNLKKKILFILVKLRLYSLILFLVKRGN